MTNESTKAQPLWLVAHDFSACAEAAANLAFDDLSATRGGGTLLVVHAFTVNVPAASVEGVSLASAFQHLEQHALAQATRGLEQIAERLRARAGRVGGAFVRVEVLARIGTPAEAILEEAHGRGATRIIVGTHGRTGITHLLLGSVAERIARLAKVPVLVAHAPPSSTKREPT